ncbi:hypothetical protein ROR02_07370 [Pararhodospirillum oryzae]|uniref:Uncharacterized protein n=1 Tax=Pararhodospirillum oryzae TaxID=478448 RepID=A0A512H560_9PROT|nr:hypothetical protein ROR02_07370 [Pararhodospirillum oryzae]
MVSFQASHVLHPALVVSFFYLRVLHLKAYVFKIISKRRTGETFYIFENEGAWPCLTHGPNRLWKHVARVVMGAVFSSEGKGLARGPSRNQVHLTTVGAEIDRSHVPLDEWPIHDVINAAFLVLSNGIATISIPLNNLNRFEPSLMKAHSQAASPCEKLD